MMMLECPLRTTVHETLELVDSVIKVRLIVVWWHLRCLDLGQDSLIKNILSEKRSCLLDCSFDFGTPYFPNIYLVRHFLKLLQGVNSNKLFPMFPH